MTLIVDFHDDGVFALFQQVGDVVVEGCESADMMTYMLGIDIYMAVVVHRTEV